MEDRPSSREVIIAPSVPLQSADDICGIAEHKDINISFTGFYKAKQPWTRSRIPYHSKPPKQNKMLGRQNGFPDVCLKQKSQAASKVACNTSGKCTDARHAIIERELLWKQMDVCLAVMCPGTWWALQGSCQFSGSAERGVTQFQVENVQAVIRSQPFVRDQLGLHREAAI